MRLVSLSSVEKGRLRSMGSKGVICFFQVDYFFCLRIYGKAIPGILLYLE